MFLFALIVAAAACVTVAWITGAVLFAYFALGLCALGLVALAFHMWRSRQATMSSNDSVVAVHAVDEPAADDQDDSDEDNDNAERDDSDTVQGEDTADEDAPADLVVHVIPGRKRFHRSGCRLLAEHDHEELTVVEAVEEGFTSCTVCGSTAPTAYTAKAG